MNSKSYESFCSIWILFFLFAFLFVGIFIYSFSTSNIRKYQMITGLVSSRNQVMVFVSNEQLKWLYHNQILLINGKKVKFSVDRKLLLIKRNIKCFYQFLLKDILSIVLFLLVCYMIKCLFCLFFLICGEEIECKVLIIWN